jgi:hypothetical protein
MIAVLAICYGVSLVVPGVRVESDPARYQVNPGLVLIEDAGISNDAQSSITAHQFQTWSARRQRFFDQFAFYAIRSESLQTADGSRGRWNVAGASANLFSLLGLRVRFPLVGPAANPALPWVILSDRLWKKEFGASSQIAGRVVRIGSQPAIVAGVAQEGAWRMPGGPDAWVLEPTAALAGVGYVVAHLSPMGRDMVPSERFDITTYYSADASQDDLLGTSFADRTAGPRNIYGFAVLLALLALPAITSVSLGEYTLNAPRLKWSRKFKRWGFLLLKFALLLPIVYFASLDLAYCGTTSYSVSAEYVQLLTAFAICLFGLRWLVLDQRKRCPVCLRRVEHPAQVGLASRTFLAWNGTELMCMGGHTLLHVPSLPTSWFSTQRWVYLDTSWDFLFVA